MDGQPRYRDGPTSIGLPDRSSEAAQPASTFDGMDNGFANGSANRHRSFKAYDYAHVNGQVHEHGAIAGPPQTSTGTASHQHSFTTPRHQDLERSHVYNGNATTANNYLHQPQQPAGSRRSSSSRHQNGTHAMPSTSQQSTSISSATEYPVSNDNENIQISSQVGPDALLVQHTYARIDEIGGIPGDGFVDGVELTRERRTQASINDYLDPLSLAASWGPSASSDRLPAQTGIRRKSEGASTSLLSVNQASSAQSRGRKFSASSRAASTKTQKEEEDELRLLKKVDRYGFFTPAYASTSSGRVACLPREPCMNIPKKPLAATSQSKGKSKSGGAGDGSLASPYIHIPSQQLASREASPRSSLRPPSGGISQSTSMSSINSTAQSVGAQSMAEKKEPGRILKWYDEMLVPARRDAGGNVLSWKFSDSISRKTNKLQRRLRKGIPDRWRLAAWEALIARMRQQSRRGASTESLERRLYDLILEPCQHDVQIDLDVPRTISGHLYFHTRYGLGQRSLFNVLHAFAMHCPDCGYCQGMGSLAATFLCYMPPEKAYASMVYLHDSYDLHTIFEPGFPGMLECFHAQESLVKLLMPDVAKRFDDNFISVSSFATKWYITLFVNVLPFSTQVRVWDLFLYGGKDVLILTATAIIWTLRDYITQPSADFEQILSLLSSFFIPADEDAFIRWIGKMLKRQDVLSHIERARAEYQENCKQKSQ